MLVCSGRMECLPSQQRVRRQHPWPHSRIIFFHNKLATGEMYKPNLFTPSIMVARGQQCQNSSFLLMSLPSKSKKENVNLFKRLHCRNPERKSRPETSPRLAFLKCLKRRPFLPLGWTTVQRRNKFQQLNGPGSTARVVSSNLQALHSRGCLG